MQTLLLNAVFHFIAKQRKKSIPKTDVLLIDFFIRGIKTSTKNGVQVFILKFALQTLLLNAVFHFIAKQRKKSIPKTDVLLIDFLRELL